MKTYKIEDEEGFEINLTGDSFPTEEELEQIFNSEEIVKKKQIWLDQQTEEVVDPRIQKERDFENTTLGKITNFPEMLLGQRKPSEKLERAAELKELPFGERLKESAKDVGRDVLRAAPMLVGGPVAKGGVQLAKGVLPRLIQLIKEGSKLGAVTGAAKTGEELLEGADIKDAAKTGLEAGALTAGTSAAIPAVAEGATSLIDGLIRSGMKIKPWALKVASKDPSMIMGKEQQIAEIMPEINKNIANYKKVVEDNYKKSLNAMNYPKGKVVSTKKVEKFLNSMKGDLSEKKFKDYLKSTIATGILSEDKKQITVVTPEIVNRLLSGKNITFDESKKLNSLLARASAEKLGDLGSGGKGVYKQIKHHLLDSMETPTVEGGVKLFKPMRRLNKRYIKRKEKFKGLEGFLGDETKKERNVKTIGEQLAGVRKYKTKLAKNLRELDRVALPEDRVVNKLIRSAVADEFETAFDKNRIGQLLSAGTGFYLGKQVNPEAPMTGGLLGGLAGFSLGQKAPLRLMTRGIGQAEKLATRYKGVPTALGRMAGASVGRNVEAPETEQRTRPEVVDKRKFEPSGNMTPLFLRELLNQRRIN